MCGDDSDFPMFKKAEMEGCEYDCEEIEGGGFCQGYCEEYGNIYGWYSDEGEWFVANEDGDWWCAGDQEGNEECGDNSDFPMLKKAGGFTHQDSGKWTWNYEAALTAAGSDDDEEWFDWDVKLTKAEKIEFNQRRMAERFTD